MDLGGHEGAGEMPMPITSSYATLHETAKMKMLTSGNGAGGDDMSANNTGVPPQLLRPMALPLVVHGQQVQQQQGQQQQQQQAPQPMDATKAQVVAMVPLQQQQQQQPQQPPLQQQQQALPPTVVVTPGSATGVSLLTTPTGAGAAAAAAGTPTSGVGGVGGGFTSPAPAKKAVRYRECHKNHAASIGGHAIDGCGEFMPSGEEGTPDALKCAACSCHRNFHRREVEGEPSCDCHLLRAGAAAGGLLGSSQLKDSRKRPAPSVSGGAGTPGAPSPIGLAGMAPAATPTLALPSTLALRAGAGGVGGAPTPILMALTSGAADSDDQEGGLGSASPAAMKKRFRTKFSSEQKEKMCSFADKLGWKIQKHDEAAVQQFCSDVGVKRHVLKVWMHNNKHTLGKKMLEAAVEKPGLEPGP